jgi:hypothetical protein
MLQRRLLPLAILALVPVMFAAGNAWAGPTARVVRSRMDDTFWGNLILMAMPLIVLGGIAALLYRIGAVLEENK